MIESSYDILEESTSLNLDRPSSANLPPDWIVMDRLSGAIQASTVPSLTTNYGYDAFRTPWRIGVDWIWNKNPRAKTYLDKLKFLKTGWETNQRLEAIYSHDGLILGNYQQVAAYGTSLGYFKVIDPELAEAIIEQKIISKYSPDQNAWITPLGYYDDNWAWFGLALNEGFIDDFE